MNNYQRWFYNDIKWGNMNIEMMEKDKKTI